MKCAKISDVDVFCGQLERPGLAVDFGLYIDFSNRETTEDQVRIEQQLSGLAKAGNHILHVGVGNSGLAARFSQEGVQITGITVSDKEVTHARNLNIPGYRVFKSNKYHRDFNAGFAGQQFEFIVDNNLSSFCCCQYHNCVMLENYLSCLRVGGKILTDQRGMDWALASPGFIMDIEQLRALTANLPVQVKALSDMVFAIEKVAHKPDIGRRITVYAKRYDDNGEGYITSFAAKD